MFQSISRKETRGWNRKGIVMWQISMPISGARQSRRAQVQMILIWSYSDSEDEVAFDITFTRIGVEGLRVGCEPGRRLCDQDSFRISIR